jgi:hypothetical protein
MDNKKFKSVLRDALEEKIPASHIDLLPAVQSHLVAGKKSYLQQGKNMSKTRIKRLVLLALTVIAVLTMALITPQGRAFAQNILQFFKRADSNVLPLPPDQIVSTENAEKIPTAAPPLPLVSVAEAETTAGFDAKELPSVPQGFNFAGAMGSPDGVTIEYRALGNGGQLIINESTNGFMQTEWDQAPVEAISQVRIGDLDAEMVQGAYVVYPGETSARWNPQAAIIRLRWIEDGIWFEMAKFGGVESIAYLDGPGLIKLAESLTGNPDNPFTLNIKEAESLAGFDVLEPNWLPGVLSFKGAAFEPKEWERKQNTVKLFYSFSSEKYGSGLETNGVVLTQQPIQSMEDCEICDLVGTDAEVEKVQIGHTKGEYVIGVWQADEAGNWRWVYEPYLQTLRWQRNNIAFEILYMGPPEEVSKADLITIAESLK